MGYVLAGFEVTGVDIVEQPAYDGEFVKGDALAVLRKPWDTDFDVIHASPPCQRYMTGGTHRKDHPDLIGTVRELLQETRNLWVIENVPGAPLRKDLMLCGSMFGLPLRRHRIFEFSEPLGLEQPACSHKRPIVGVYGNMHGKAGAWPTMRPSNEASWCEALGITPGWMTPREMSQAIPPAYTEFIGRQLMAALDRRKEA
jgi:DNA (cytosine-5)-methyltransferase 1